MIGAGWGLYFSTTRQSMYKTYIKLIALSSVLWLVAGCNTVSHDDAVTIPKPAPYTGKIETISALQVWHWIDSLAAQHGVKAEVLLEDREYFIPEHRWVSDLFGKWLPKAIEALDLEYVSESWDCDDISAFAVMGARLALADKEATVTIARISLEPEYKGKPRHQIVAFLSDQGLFFVEPQISQGYIRIWQPDKDELERIYKINLRGWEVEVSK